MAWYKVSNPIDYNISFIKKVNAGGKAVCLINAEDHLYALAATCPHAGADLSAGWCNNGKLICPYHRYQYDLSTGRGGPGQNDYVRNYRVEVKEDGIYIEITGWFDALRRMFNG